MLDLVKFFKICYSHAAYNTTLHYHSYSETPPSTSASESLSLSSQGSSSTISTSSISKATSQLAQSGQCFIITQIIKHSCEAFNIRFFCWISKDKLQVPFHLFRLTGSHFHCMYYISLHSYFCLLSMTFYLNTVVICIVTVLVSYYTFLSMLSSRAISFVHLFAVELILLSFI